MATSEETKYANKVFMAGALPLMKIIANEDPKLSATFKRKKLNAVYQVSAIDEGQKHAVHFVVENGVWDVFQGEYNGYNHYNNISASISNKVGTDDVKATIKVTLSGSTSATTTVINAGTYIATVESLSGTSAGNYKLPSTKPTQNYILSKASSSMTFEPGSITTDYSTSAVTKAFNAASGQSGTVQYTITAGGTGFTLGTANNITAKAGQTAKTSYSITLKAYDPGDTNHEPKTIDNKTLT